MGKDDFWIGWLIGIPTGLVIAMPLYKYVPAITAFFLP